MMRKNKPHKPTGIPAVFAEVSKYLNNFKKRKDAQLILDWIDVEGLNPSQQLQYFFLQGRIHALNYKSTKKITHLEEASNCYDQLFDTARKYGQKISSSRYYFATIHTKYLLSQKHASKKVRSRNKRIAYQTLCMAKDFIDGNTSMEWIASKLNPSGIFPQTINLKAYWK
jgi:hypothetical protein